MTRRWCADLTVEGMPCRSRPLRDGERCLMHDPAHADEAREARRLGGLRRRRESTISAAFDIDDLRSVDGQWRLLEVLVSDTLHLDNGIQRNRTLLQAVTVATKLVATADLERRLAAIGLAIGSRRRRRAGAEPRSLLDRDPDASL